MTPLEVPKVKLPDIKNLNWSKLNLRRLNWLTIITLLSYLNILVLIPLFFMKKSDFAQYHARQGLALLVLTVLFSFTFYLPLIPWIFAILILVCLLVGVANVVRGLERPLPLVGKLASK